MRAVVHLLLHGLVPLAAARALYPGQWRRAFLVMFATMVIDLDHLLARPVYDPDRCSVGYHPLHTAPAAALYVLLALVPRTRWVGLGLVIHLLLDGLDCAWMRM